MSRRAKFVWASVAASVGIAALLLPTLVGGWAPLLHTDCLPGASPAETLYAWVPALLINSPFGGEAFGNATVAPGPLSLSVEGTTYELGIQNGSASWAGFRAEINVTGVENQTVWGPGQDVRCTTPFAVSVRYWGGIVLGGPLLGKGNTSDSAMPTSLGHWTYPGDVNLTISNGFSAINYPFISTCGGGAASIFQKSSQFEVGIPVAFDGRSYAPSFALPIHETFHYLVPANFGIWQIDNLSAPGGPGGGLAFAYSPCS
jgi:hypothetical protein